MSYCYRFLSLLPILLLLCNILLLTAEARRQGDALTKFLQAKKANNFQQQLAKDLNLEVINHQFHGNDIVISQLQGSKDTDKITKLPGQPDQKNIDFAQYGGYVTVDHPAGRALFYYFAEVVGSLHATNNKPLLLWLNGGPGCSSLGYGAMEELGPFRVMSDGKTLYRNEFSWNNVANVLFLESPAGVGFSYSNTTSDYDACGDAATAKDSFVFLVNWLERFPDYKNRDFYIAGESYAGHYVPQLAHTILERNELDNKTYLNLKGIMIGNAAINDETDSLGMFDFFWTHALISDETINDMHKYCNFSSDATTQPKQCSDANDEVGTDLSALDIYSIYSPLCFSSNLTDKPKKASVLEFDPCSDNYVDAYLNTPGVQEVLHANVTGLTHPWSACTAVITRWTDSPSTILPLMKEFMAKGLRVWVFSGDVDGRIPVTSTRYSLNTLQLPLKSKWRPWIVENEVGGYTVVYKGDITLATVRGAGHEVPSYQPKRALALAKSFLLGEPLPAS